MLEQKDGKILLNYKISGNYTSKNFKFSSLRLSHLDCNEGEVVIVENHYLHCLRCTLTVQLQSYSEIMQLLDCATKGTVGKIVHEDKILTISPNIVTVSMLKSQEENPDWQSNFNLKKRDGKFVFAYEISAPYNEYNFKLSEASLWHLDCNNGYSVIVNEKSVFCTRCKLSVDLQSYSELLILTESAVSPKHNKIVHNDEIIEIYPFGYQNDLENERERKQELEKLAIFEGTGGKPIHEYRVIGSYTDNDLEISSIKLEHLNCDGGKVEIFTNILHCKGCRLSIALDNYSEQKKVIHSANYRTAETIRHDDKIIRIKPRY